MSDQPSTAVAARDVEHRRAMEELQAQRREEGFTWDVQDRQRDLAAAARGWARACELIAAPDYDFILLDELNIALRNDYLDIASVVHVLATRPKDKHICITGRDAKPALIEIADLVTEMTVTKHPYDAGYRAQKGVEF